MSVSPASRSRASASCTCVCLSPLMPCRGAGVIVWAPWLALVTAVVLAPSVREMEYRESYLEGEVLSRAQREYLHRVPVTPKESAAWVGLCSPAPSHARGGWPCIA